ncbi:hypothetical protein ACRAWD_07810 [Caulobacter segnis]
MERDGPLSEEPPGADRRPPTTRAPSATPAASAWSAPSTANRCREVVELAIKALKALAHRGAVDADGKTRRRRRRAGQRSAGLLRRPGAPHRPRPAPGPESPSARCSCPARTSAWWRRAARSSVRKPRSFGFC